MTNASQGAQAKAAMDPSTFDTSSEPYEFTSENLKLTAEHLQTNGIRGTRSRPKETMREGLDRVGGTIILEPSPADLDILLPRILGAAEVTDTFSLAETLPSFNVMLDRVSKVFTYSTCYVNRATFSSSEGGLLQLALDIIGTSETVGNAGTFPALTLGTAANNAPYVHTDTSGAVTLAGSARQTKSIEIIIDNLLVAAFNNSQTANDITPQDRIITVRTTHPYDTDNTDLYAQALAGAAGSIVYTNGNMSTTFTFANLKVPDNSPVVSGKTSIPLELNMQAFQSGSTKELVVTHDSTA